MSENNRYYEIKDRNLYQSLQENNPLRHEFKYNQQSEDNDIYSILNKKVFIEQNLNNTIDYSTNYKDYEHDYIVKDKEIYQKNFLRLQALETGNPKLELERMDKNLCNFLNKITEENYNYYDDDHNYDNLIDPLIDKIKFPEKYFQKINDENSFIF